MIYALDGFIIVKMELRLHLQHERILYTRKKNDLYQFNMRNIIRCKLTRN